MFKKAVRQNVKLKIGVTGPSGSGKTMSSILMAKGLGKKIALLDTENNSAGMYSHLDFDTCVLSEPFTTKKYIESIKGAEKAGYDVLIIDSITHAWAGEGGILTRKTVKDSIGGNSFTNWAPFTKEQNEFVQAILSSSMHIICTIRSKVDYILTENDKGKSMPKKVGLAPIQREGFEYEFSIVFDISSSHVCTISKDRTGLFDGKEFVITEKTGEEIKAFLESGECAEESITKDQIIKLLPNIIDVVKRSQIMNLVNDEKNEVTLIKYLSRLYTILDEQEDEIKIKHDEQSVETFETIGGLE